jgi:hypothetical protein
MSLERLPDEAIRSLRSSFILTSLLRAAEELLHNGPSGSRPDAMSILKAHR